MQTTNFGDGAALQKMKQFLTYT